MLRRKKVPRKDKAPTIRYTVVREDDAREPKYLYAEAAEGFTLEHAEQLAQPVKGQRCNYAVVPLHVNRQARAAGVPLTAAQALSRFPSESDDA